MTDPSGSPSAGAAAMTLPNRRKIIAHAKASPPYWAATVPHAMPMYPSPLKPALGRPVARKMLSMMFVPFTTRSVSMELTVSCIPMNQPLSTMSESVAGAAQILRRKYLVARCLTSSEQLTKKKISFSKGHCMAISTSDRARAVSRLRRRFVRHPAMSPRPNACAVRPPVPALRKPKFQ